MDARAEAAVRPGGGGGRHLRRHAASCSTTASSPTLVVLDERASRLPRHRRGRPRHPPPAAAQGALSAQTSTTVGTIIGRRRYVSLTQRPTVRRTICCSWCGSVMPSAAARSSASVTSGSTGSNAAGSSEKPFAGHRRAADHLAGDRVDHHGGRDEAAVAEDAPLGERATRRRRRRRDRRRRRTGSSTWPTSSARPSTRSTTSPSSQSTTRSVGTPGLDAEPGVRAQVPPLAVHRHEVARLDHVEQVEQLAGGRVPGDVHLGHVLVHDHARRPGTAG